MEPSPADNLVTPSTQRSRFWRTGYKVYVEWTPSEDDDEEETTEEEQEAPNPAAVQPEDNAVRYQAAPGYWVCLRPKTADQSESTKSEKTSDIKEV